MLFLSRTSRLTFAAVTALGGLAVALAIWPFIPLAMGAAAFCSAAVVGSGLAGALCADGFGHPKSGGAALALGVAFVMTGLGAEFASNLMLLSLEPSAAYPNLGFGLGLLALFLGLGAIWPAVLWVLVIAALHGLAKALRRR